MTNILVSGLINIETTLQVDAFPIPYFPVRYPFYGIHSTVSGVGYNLARALTVLGHQVHFLSLIGQGIGAQQTRTALAADGIAGQHVLSLLAHTAQSVILYDPNGRRQIHTDLKNIQQQAYPLEIFEQQMRTCELLALCNINFSRPMLARARQAGKRIASDVHTIASLEDEYNRDFMAAAHILFMSDEALPMPPEDWARAVAGRFGTEIIVIGLGSQGALLHVPADNFLERIPAVQTRPVVNTIGAGDALFASFLHGYATHGDPYSALQKAIVFAAYKIGETGAAQGFLDAGNLDELYSRLQGN
ncbi:MAG: carbohydrate kinase family protein [Anaerolineales bacterium]|nr:carbohydrate kinase family protein [Anaerolineales bacterium]